MALPPASLLQLIWLASPSLPIGGFSYSEGLESAVDASFVATETEAFEWLEGQLHVTLARADLAVIAQAIPAWRTNDVPRLHELNDWVLQTRETAEFRLQTEQMGRSLLAWLQLHHQDAAEQFAPLPSPTYPVAYAFSASRTEASSQDACLAFAFGWAENMVAAAVKALPLGQSAGQRILARLVHEIPVAVDAALRVQDADRQAFSPMLAILSARHETQYSRLFRS